MADKVAVFTVTLNGIYPEMTDEWVKGISEESETVEEFRKEIRENIEEYNKEKVQSQLRSEVMEALLNQIEVKKLPEKDVEKEVSDMREHYEGVAEQYELDFAEFLSTYMGMDEESFETKAKEEAEKAVTRKLACELIANKKNLNPDKKEIEEMTKKYAEQAGYDDAESFKKDFGEDVIETTILQTKVADYLVENCVQVEASDDTKTE